jgi:hypothetical protein
VLVVAGSAGPLAAFEIVAAEEMEKVGGFEIGNFVGLSMFVDEEREVDTGFLLEDASVMGVAEANGGEGGAPFTEGLLVFAQLRDVLAAEDSAIVAKENEDGGIRFPERAETDGFAEGVWKNDAGELLAEGFRHDGHD